MSGQIFLLMLSSRNVDWIVADSEFRSNPLYRANTSLDGKRPMLSRGTKHSQSAQCRLYGHV